MNKKLDQQARETLMRALPHLLPERREILTAVLMGEMFNVHAWLKAKRIDDSFHLDWYVYYTLHAKQSDVDFFIRLVNIIIDDIESRATGP